MKPGHYEVLAYPTVYDAKRIGSIPGVADAVRQSTVSLRGWDFPHTDKGAAPFATGFQSATAWTRYVEGYRMHQSGLFLWRRDFWEDIEDRKTRDGRPTLSFLSAIWAFTEYLLFLSRLYERIAPDTTVRLEIAIHGCAGRELAAFDAAAAFWGGYVATDDVIRQEREVQVSELRATHTAIAAEMVMHVLHVFGWLDVNESMIVSRQQQLLKKQV